MTEKWCLKCKRWISKGECEHESKFNKALRAAMLNTHLYNQAGRVTKERTDQAHFVKQARREAKRVGA